MTNRRALLLSSLMMRGYGVSVVAHEVAARFSTYGWDLSIGCMTADATYRAPNVFELGSDVDAVAAHCRAHGIEVVAAQTTPYFEMLPLLAGEFTTVVFEHGDPSPHFFDEDAIERESIRQNKISNVYPAVSRVLASSHFLRHDIEWPSAGVVPLGCDHVPDPGPKDLALTAHRQGTPLRVGTLMRLGEGESKYKGVDLYSRLVDEFSTSSVEFAIMGRGEEVDRDRWASRGVTVHLNASDEERSRYLRELDVFISPSMWEGFNLPLVEAQASGTVALGFDVGAHPETTPFLVRDVADAADLIGVFAADRNELSRASRLAYRYARSKFSWDDTARLLAHQFTELCPVSPPAPASPQAPAPASYPQRLRRLIAREGLIGAGRVAGARLRTRLRRPV